MQWNPALDQMQPYQVPPSAGLIKLDAMENPFGLPPVVAQAFAQRVAGLPTNRYPDAAGRALKELLMREFPAPAGYGCVLGNGSDELISLLMTAVLRPGACVLAPEPCFVMYRHSAQTLGLDYQGVPLQADFGLDMQATLAAIERLQPALVFLASPNNPTGNLYAEEDILTLAAASPGLFVLDQAYIPYASQDGAAIAERAPNLVLLRTLSKWGLAGLRLGFVQASPGVCEQLEKVRPPYNTNVLSQELAQLCLQHADAFAQQVQVLKEQRAWLRQALAHPRVHIFDSAANFLLIRVPDAPARHARLRDHAGILVKCLHGGHPHLEHCLRISVGTPAENQALAQAWAELTLG